MLGARTAPLDFLRWIGKPSAGFNLSVNTQVRTDFVSLGLNWRVPVAAGGRLYLRPGFGIAYTNGLSHIGNPDDGSLSKAESLKIRMEKAQRIDFGSKTLFQPEVALGYQATQRIALELSYVHLSTGQIFNKGANQGLDDLGVRVAYSF